MFPCLWTSTPHCYLSLRCLCKVTELKVTFQQSARQEEVMGKKGRAGSQYLQVTMVTQSSPALLLGGSKDGLGPTGSQRPNPPNITQNIIQRWHNSILGANPCMETGI